MRRVRATSIPPQPSMSLEDSSYSIHWQEISHLVWKPKFYYRALHTQRPDPVLSHMYPVQNHIIYSFIFLFILFSPIYDQDSQEVSSFQVLQPKLYIEFSPTECVIYAPPAFYCYFSSPRIRLTEAKTMCCDLRVV